MLTSAEKPTAITFGIYKKDLYNKARLKNSNAKECYVCEAALTSEYQSYLERCAQIIDSSNYPTANTKELPVDDIPRINTDASSTNIISVSDIAEFNVISAHEIAQGNYTPLFCQQKYCSLRKEFAKEQNTTLGKLLTFSFQELSQKMN